MRIQIPIRSTVVCCAAISCLALTPSLTAAQNPLVPETPPTEEEADATKALDVEAAEGGVHPLTKTDVDAWLDGFMPYALEDGQIVGAVVSVVKDGEILTSRGYGYAGLEPKMAMDPARTLVRPGSVSKLFTWTAIMQLVEQGKVDLDADLNAYIDFKIPDAFGAPITVRHLLTHTPGFEEAVKGLIAKDPEALVGLEDYVKSSVPTRVYPPGTTPAYSNYGTALAGYIVQRVSGMSFDDYIERNIFEPLGMHRSTFRQPLPEKFEDAMSGGFESSVKNEPQFFELVGPAPAGSLSSTAEDMARFMIAHLNEGGPLLTPETARVMHTTLDQHTPPLNAMALGFYQQNQHGAKSIGHGGDTVFFHSDLRIFPDHDAGLFVSMNSSGDGAVSLTLREALGREFAERYFPEAAPVEEKTLETALEHGAQIAGVYESSRASITSFLAVTRYLGQTKISVDEETGDLLLPFIGTATRWREIEPFVWRRVDGPDRLAAVLREDGRVDHVSFEPVSPFMILSPAPWHRSSAILTPLIGIACAVLALTIFLWPVRAIVRWRYKTPFGLSGSEALAYRLIRVGALASLGLLVAWMMVINSASSNLTVLSPAFDSNWRLLQLGQFAFYAALAIALWNSIVNWSKRRSWFAMSWSAILLLSMIVVVWFAAVAGWFGFDLTY